MKKFLLLFLLFPVCLTSFAQIPDSILFAERQDTLEEIVVVGYGMVRKSDLTGAVLELPRRIRQDGFVFFAPHELPQVGDGVFKLVHRPVLRCRLF